MVKTVAPEISSVTWTCCPGSNGAEENCTGTSVPEAVSGFERVVLPPLAKVTVTAPEDGTSNVRMRAWPVAVTCLDVAFPVPVSPANRSGPRVARPKEELRAPECGPYGKRIFSAA
jgi:hypothetical protein